MQWTQKILPADQRLNTADVVGNLQQGGHIGQLHWQKNGLQIHASQVDVQLDWSRLWHQPWPVKHLKLGALHIEDQRAAQEAIPMTALTLPMTVQLAWQVDRLSWHSTGTLTLTDLSGQYRYDGDQHALTLDRFGMAKGHYALQARLQAAAPMALNVLMQGQVPVLDKSGQRSTTLALESSVQGTLSGPQARLTVQARVAPEHFAKGAQATPLAKPTAGRHATETVQLHLQAQVQPWAKPVIAQANIEGQALDLALFWTGAPQTHLNGWAHIQPEAEGWRLDSQWRNAQSGPWNQQRLPLSELDVQARHQDGLWQVLQLKAQMAGGQLRGQGRQTPRGWTGQIEWQDLLPAQLHTALAGPAIQGRLHGQDTGADGIEFQADLNPSASAIGRVPSDQSMPHERLPWGHLHLQGLWRQQEWDIRNFVVEAAQARLNAQFKFHPVHLSVQGQAQLRLPGLQAQLQGLLAPAGGEGQLNMDMPDAAQSLKWLQRWPDLDKTLKGLQALGTGQLKAQWQGGFQQEDTAIALSLTSPRLQYSSGKNTHWDMSPSQFQLQGNMKALQAQIGVRVSHGSDTAEIKTSLSAHRPDLKSLEWQGQVLGFQLEGTAQSAATAWRAQLQKPWPWQLDLHPTTQGLKWDSALWLLQGPTPGTARLWAEAGQWRPSTPVQEPRLQGSARWEDLPLNWLPGALNADVHSDVLLKGHWQMQLDKQLNMSAAIQRSQGDLRIHADSFQGQRMPAGLREARMTVRLQGDDLEADLAWDSEHMGQLKAQLQTQVHASSQDGLQWAEQAPIRGHLAASLPKVGAWSLLAPPGWRVQGTLDAQMDLSGTRSQPQWQGRLQAENLAVRSAVEGIEFSQGQLIARLQGEQLILERLSLRGAGVQGGDLQAQGKLSWNPAASGFDASKPLSAARLLLQVQAKRLRVSQRADRRLALSGLVTAEMDQGLLSLKGLLQADQALFILPEANTPSLGSDVTVLRADTPAPATGRPPPTKSWLGTPDVQVRLDLGSDFQVQGQGLNTRLKGQVMLVSNSASRGLPRLSGQVQTDGGRYQAYGQQLVIDTGVLRFNGAYDNPSLEIIALRPNLSQRVGVQVSGTALLPRIRLYADPDMPDADKLAWLVLGRSAASGGAESAVLQQAALALLGGSGKGISAELASSLGLDEISLASGSRSDASATGAALTLGKRLSKDFYMAYESSLSGTFGSLYIFYDLSQRLTLRAQAGQQSALDLIFTVRKN